MAHLLKEYWASDVRWKMSDGRTEPHTVTSECVTQLSMEGLTDFVSIFLQCSGMHIPQ